METTKYTRISCSAIVSNMETSAAATSCTCRSKNTTTATRRFHKSSTVDKIICNNTTCLLLLLITILPLILMVRAAPSSHQNNEPSLLETAALVTKTASANAINSSALAALETNLKSNSLLPSQTNSTAHPEHSRALKKAYLSNRSIVCNDGTAAGFYLRKNPNSKKWIVFLEGGWHCYDKKTCRARWNRLRHLMTSTDWPETRDGKFFAKKNKLLQNIY